MLLTPIKIAGVVLSERKGVALSSEENSMVSNRNGLDYFLTLWYLQQTFTYRFKTLMPVLLSDFKLLKKFNNTIEELSVWIFLVTTVMIICIKCFYFQIEIWSLLV